jgi:hypothetical protein
METPMFAKYMENITVAKDPTYSPTAQPPASDPSGLIKSRPRSKSTTKHGPIKVDYVTAGYVKKIANFYGAHHDEVEVNRSGETTGDLSRLSRFIYPLGRPTGRPASG